MPHDLDLEVAVPVENFLGVVGVGARAAVEHCQRAAAEQGIQAALPGVEELADFGLGEILEAPARSDASVNKFGNDDTAVQRSLPRGVGSASREGCRWARYP